MFRFLSKCLGTTVLYFIIIGCKEIRYSYEALIGEKKSLNLSCLRKKLFKFCKWFKHISTTAIERKHFKQCNPQLIPDTSLNQVERNLYLKTRETTERESSREWTNITNNQKGLTVLYTTKQNKKSIQRFTRKHRSFFMQQKSNQKCGFPGAFRHHRSIECANNCKMWKGDQN